MRMVCISDTHGMHRQLEIPDGDLLIHSGDCLGVGTLEEVEELDNWFSELPHKHKILIAGNHDWCFQKEPEEAIKRVRHAHYLLDSALEIDGLKFWGSPWVPAFFNFAFNLERGDALAERWAQIPDDTDVLITHGPPAGILDKIVAPNGKVIHPGCEDLAIRVESLSPRLHIFGHIHEGYGQQQIGNCLYVNASTCNSRFKPVNPPIVLDI